MNSYIISLGSNINPQENMKQAVQILQDKFELLLQSDFLITTPEEYTNQDDFLNGSVQINANLSPEELKKELHVIEKSLLRVRTENKNGPRTIDLDITAINGDIIDPDYEKYWFVKKSVDQILSKTEESLLQ